MANEKPATNVPATPGRPQSEAKPTDPGQMPGGRQDQDGPSVSSKPGPHSAEIDSGKAAEKNRAKVDEDARRNEERDRDR